jgi:hypothetical protein
MQMRLSSHVLSLSLFPLLLWIVALINKDRKCLDQIRYYYGLISTKVQNCSCGRRRQIRHKLSLLMGQLSMNQLLLCACMLFLSFEGTHPSLRNTSFFLLFSNSLLQSAFFGIFLSHSPLWKISKWVSETCQASTLQASSQCWIGILNISSEHVLELAFKSPCLWALVWSLQILSHPNLILAV